MTTHAPTIGTYIETHSSEIQYPTIASQRSTAYQKRVDNFNLIIALSAVNLSTLILCTCEII